VSAIRDLREILDEVCAWCPICGWSDFTDNAAPGFTCPWCDAPILPPRSIEEPMMPLLLMPPRHRKSRDLIFLDGPYARCLITLKWDRLSPFEGAPGCLVVCDAPVSAWRDDETDDWESTIYFEGREGWKAAYRIARQVAASHPALRATLRFDDTTAIIALYPGPKTACRWRLEGEQ
jgi:hypothetical protein